jgi:uncharacterized protein with HEPN domain
MPHPDHVYLADILDAARLIQEFLAGIDREQFLRDPLRESAVIRQLEIIGEAAKQVSADFRHRHDRIPWRNMAGMRDVLIHAYRGVDLEQVWTAATVSVPALIPVLEPFLPAVPEEEA